MARTDYIYPITVIYEMNMTPSILALRPVCCSFRTDTCSFHAIGLLIDS